MTNSEHISRTSLQPATSRDSSSALAVSCFATISASRVFEMIRSGSALNLLIGNYYRVIAEKPNS